MKKIVLFASTLMLALPVVASAHAHASYLIGGTQYDVVIGSLNEPIAVDDKTGLDLRVTSGGRMEKAEDGDMEPVGGKPATGLEQTLQVELISGDKKKTQDISPAYGVPGSYKTVFYPTSNATFSYRLFGTINETPVDLTFTCRAEGETDTEEEEKEISSGVKQLLKGGGFGCPTPKAELGFPQESASIVDIQSNAGSRTLWGTGISVVALALAALAFVRSRRQ